MLEHAITYTDFDGHKRTDTFYFHLPQTSLVEIAMNVLGFDAGPNVDIEAIMKGIVARGNASEIMNTFRNIIAKSVGQKSEDGRRFIQKPEVVDDFMESNAYQELFIMLLQDERFREKFFEGILPPKLAEKYSQARNEPREYTTEQLLAMDDDEFYKYAGELRHMTPGNLAIAMQRKNREPA